MDGMVQFQRAAGRGLRESTEDRVSAHAAGKPAVSVNEIVRVVERQHLPWLRDDFNVIVHSVIATLEGFEQQAFRNLLVIAAAKITVVDAKRRAGTHARQVRHQGAVSSLDDEFIGVNEGYPLSVRTMVFEEMLVA